MSEWRLFVRAVAAAEPGEPVPTNGRLSGALQAEALGLVRRSCLQRKRREQIHWLLTPLGREYVENRVEQTENKPGGRRWVATWLRALPVGTRIVPIGSQTPEENHW
jgi:hypothetical protein